MGKGDSSMNTAIKDLKLSQNFNLFSPPFLSFSTESHHELFLPRPKFKDN